MFLWDDVGETRIRFEGATIAAPAVNALLDAVTVPIAIHDHARAGILGTGTLLTSGERTLLLTAAHLFERATTSGNWLVPERASGRLLSLEGAQVRVIEGADIALVDLARTRSLGRLMRGRTVLPARLALYAGLAMRRRKARAMGAAGTTYCLAGYPTVWSRFECGYLAAKRLTVTTVASAGACSAGVGDTALPELRCVYGHSAERHDGQVIHTPALEGMSGAAIWRIERGRCESALQLAGVQSAFMHGRYLRGDAATLCSSHLRQ